MPPSQSAFRRPRLRRIVLGFAGLLLLTACAATGALYWWISGDGIRQALERQASAWLGQPVRIGAATMQIVPRPAIKLTDVRVGEPVSLTLAVIAVSADPRGLMRRQIENAELTVSNSRIVMPLPFSRRSGPAAATGSEPIRLVSIRSIALDNVRLISRGREIVVDADSSLIGTRLNVRRFAARAGGTALEAEGIVELSPRVDATMRVKADSLDLDELVALGDAFTPDAAAGRRSAPPARIAARVSAETARAAGVEVRQFATDMQVDGDEVSLSPMTFQLFGGRYQGSINARLGRNMRVALQARVIDLDVGQLAVWGGVPGAVTGTMTGAGAFTGNGADFAEVLKTARGDGSASIVNGTIERLNLIRTVVLFFGRPAPDAAAATDAFERMDLRFSLANRVFSAQAFALHSGDADIAGSGTLTLDTRILDGQLDLSLSEALSAQAGTDLRRYTREGDRIVLPARLAGTLGEPRLRIDATAAVQRGLRNEIQRRLGGLLERFGQ